MTHFYRLIVDDAFAVRFLDEPIDAAGNAIDARDFTLGVPYQGPTPAKIAVETQGFSAPFAFGAFDMPVCHKSLCGVLKDKRLLVELFPVQIEGDEDFAIVNVLDVVDCIDEQQSKFTKWEERDGRPDKLGQYRMFTSLRLSAEKAAGHHLFRLAGWNNVLVVSEALRDKFIETGCSGLGFKRLT